MKNVNIVSKVVARKGEALASPSKDASTVNLSDFLLKSIWDKVFEFRTDSQGIEYIFGKIPVVTQYGITMYSGDGVDVPSLASGLPFDGRTIWYNPDTQQIEVIGGTGGGSGEGVSNFWDLSGIPSWITNTKPKYTYSEIEGTPDLTKYALASQIPSLSGYATESWVTKQNYATKATTLSGYGITDAYTKTNVDDLLKAYVTLSGSQTITGEKNFTGGLKVNGSPIYYDTAKKYWKLEGDLLVTGGVTMYGSDSSFTPSTIMDAIAVDGTTISKSGGVLKVIGGTGGGVADSVAWGNITGKPTWIGSSKPTYSYSEITGAISTTELQNYLTQNSYLNVTSGDNRYLMLSGGTLTLPNHVGLVIKRTNVNSPVIAFYNNDELEHNYIGFEGNRPIIMNKVGVASTIWHSGNFTPSNYLPLSGGTLTGTLTISVGNLIVSGSDTVTNSLYPTKDNQYTLGNSSRYWSDIYTKLINGGTPWTSANDGSGSGLDADLLDGKQPSELNVASATKLQTAKTIWGQSFDGTGNVDGKILLTSWDNDGVGLRFHNNTKGVAYVSMYAADGNAYLFGQNGNRFLINHNVYGDIFNVLGGNVGVGTPTPAYTLDVNGSQRVYSSAQTVYKAFVIGQGVYGSSGYYSSDIRFEGGISNRGGVIRCALEGSYATFDSFSFYSADVNSYSLLAKLDASGNILTTGGITMYSDQRKKTILNHVELSLKQIAEAPLIEHYYNSDEKRTTHVGSIAQYWASMNDWFCKKDSEGFLTMEIQNAALASAISIARELDRYETKTDKAIKKLKKRICELEEEVERLKSA